jgi:hypothetical protein
MADIMDAPLRDEDDALARAFTSAFTTVPGSEIEVNWYGAPWCGVRRRVHLPLPSRADAVIDAVFPELAMPPATARGKIRHLFSGTAARALCESLHVDTLSFHGVQGGTHDPCWIRRPLNTYIAEVRAWSPSGPVRRKLRRAEKSGVDCIPPGGRSDLEALRATVDSLTLGPRDSAEAVSRQVDFMERCVLGGRGLALLAIHGGVVVGGMFSVHTRNRLFMLLHGYDPTAVSCGASDALYAATLAAGGRMSIPTVCWGEVEPGDKGLARMKRGYSTACRAGASLHWMGSV